MKYFKPMLLFLLILLALCVTVVSLTKLLRTSAGLYVGKEQTCIYTDAYRAGDYEQDEAMQDILADLIFFRCRSRSIGLMLRSLMKIHGCSRELTEDKEGMRAVISWQISMSGDYILS